MRVRRDNLLHVTRGTNCIFFMQTLITIYIKERVLAGSMTFNRRHKWNDYSPGPVSLEIYWEVNVSPSKCFRQLKLITYVPCKKVYCWMPGCLATINCILRSAQRKASSPWDKFFKRIGKIYKLIEK